MSTPERANPTNDHVDLAGYLMDMLSEDEKRQADEHLAGCTECREEIESLREWSTALTSADEAMLLDGPPDDADLLLQRTLRQVRDESSSQRRRRFAVVTAAAALIAVVAVGGGVLVGRGTAPDRPPLAQPTASVGVEGAVTATGKDAATGAAMTVTVLPAAGWVRLTASVSGIPAGEKCRLEVVGRDGTPVLAGSWLVSAQGEANGTPLNGSALIAREDITAVRVVNTAGKEFVNVAV